MTTDAPVISIRVAAETLGVSVRTLRYYEEVGLLEAAQRGPGGVRYYTEAGVQRVRRIIELRNLGGFSLEEVRAYLDAEAQLDVIKSTYQRASVAEKLAALDQAEELLQRELAVVEAKMRGLTALQQQLRERLQRAAHLRAELRGSGPRS